MALQKRQISTHLYFSVADSRSGYSNSSDGLVCEALRFSFLYDSRPPNSFLLDSILMKITYHKHKGYYKKSNLFHLWVNRHKWKKNRSDYSIRVILNRCFLSLGRYGAYDKIMKIFTNEMLRSLLDSASNSF